MQEFGKIVGAKPAEVAAAEAWLSSLSPAQFAIVRAHGPGPVSTQFLKETGAVPADISGVCLAATVGGSALGGGAVGSLGGPAGTAAGLIIGAIGGAIAGYYACQVGNQQAQLLAQLQQWEAGLMSSYGNEINLSSVFWGPVLMSALNISLVGWQRAADNAALMQVGNQSFSIPEDLFQSGVADNLSSVYLAMQNQTYLIWQPIATWLNVQGSGAGYYASVNPCFPGGASNVCAPAVSASAVPVLGDIGLYSGTTASSVDLYVKHNSIYYNQCVAGTWAYQNIVTGLWYNQSKGTLTFTAAGTCSGRFTGPTGVYHFFPPSSTAWTYLAGGERIPAYGAQSINGSGGFPNGFWWVGYAGSSSSSEVTTPGTIMCMGWSSVCHTASYSAVTGSLFSSYSTWIGSLELQAAENAQVYWSFLRSIGYTSVGFPWQSGPRVPANCIVPAPYITLPSAVAAGDLTVAQLTSLYLGMLQGMATFYNTSLSSTSFCGTQATKQFNIGSEIWGNLFINATGYVYLTNGTTPVDMAGKALPTEKFSNVSTWAIGNTTYACWGNSSTTGKCKGPQQLYLMPTLGTVTVPVGKKWAIPAANPVQVFAIQSGVMLRLVGNGSNPGGTTFAAHPFAAAAGSAIYLTTCTIGGSATRNCTVTVQTLNATAASITCPVPGGCTPSPPSSGGLFFNFPNPFTAFTNWLSSLFGGGPLGQFLGGLAEAIIILVIIGVLLYLLVSYVEGRGRDLSEGSRGNRRAVVGFRLRRRRIHHDRMARIGSMGGWVAFGLGVLIVGIGVALMITAGGFLAMGPPVLLGFGVVLVALGLYEESPARRRA